MRNYVGCAARLGRPRAIGGLVCGLVAQAAAAQALPDIVVTAERRPAPAQSIGIAVSAIDGTTLAARGTSGLNALQYQTPGLEAVPAFGGGQPNFRLRGVGFDDYASNNSSPVGVYVDEVAKPFPIQTQGLLFDVDRVEVLRGPQGTLYGRNSTAGAINILTNQPKDRFGVGVDADYGSFGLFRGEAYVTGPLGEGLSARLAAGTEQGGGFQHDRASGRGLGDADRWGTRGTLAYTAGRLSLTLAGSYSRDRSEVTGLTLFAPLGTIPADRSARSTGWGGSATFAGLVGIAADAKPFRDNVTGGVRGKATLDLGGPTLTAISAYERFHRREYNDWDASALADAGTFFDSRASVFSQELRLASAATAGTHWIAGGYYADERLHDRFTSDFIDSLGFVARTAYRQRARVEAGFGQVDQPVGQNLTLTAGLRLEHERRTLSDFTTSTVPAVGIGAGAAAETLGTTQATGRLAATYRLSPASLVYASASRGTKSGGFTAYNTLSPDQLAPFRPEVLYAYELGTKNELAGRRLRLNAAAFYYDYRRQQVQSAIYDPLYGAIGKIVNAPRSHIYGLEAELAWMPVTGVTIDQGLSWRRGKFDRFLDLDIAASTAAGAARTIDRRGQDEGFPRWSYTGDASWRFDLGARLAATLAADWSYRSALDPVLLGPRYRVAGYWLANANVSVGPRGGRWTLGLYVRNLTATRYDLTRNFFLSGIDIAAPGRPRSVGVRGRYAF